MINKHRHMYSINEYKQSFYIQLKPTYIVLFHVIYIWGEVGHHLEYIWYCYIFDMCIFLSIKTILNCFNLLLSAVYQATGFIHEVVHFVHITHRLLGTKSFHIVLNWFPLVRVGCWNACLLFYVLKHGWTLIQVIVYEARINWDNPYS